MRTSTQFALAGVVVTFALGLWTVTSFFHDNDVSSVAVNSPSTSRTSIQSERSSAADKSSQLVTPGTAMAGNSSFKLPQALPNVRDDNRSHEVIIHADAVIEQMDRLIAQASLPRPSRVTTEISEDKQERMLALKSRLSALQNQQH